jgi:hypothetical protein
MPRYNKKLLIVRILWQLLLFDLVLALGGFRSVYRGLARHEPPARPPRMALESAICGTVSMACCFYWKPVRCLQRSAVTARVLRSYGIDASIVIGYRPAPLYSHAWVEVAGRVVNGPSGYQRKLCPLVRV